MLTVLIAAKHNKSIKQRKYLHTLRFIGRVITMVPRRAFVKRFQQIARRRRGRKSYNRSKLKRTAHKHDGTEGNFKHQLVILK